MGSLSPLSAAQADSFKNRETKGIIEAIRFSDPDEKTNILGEVDVEDGLGKKITVEVTLDTLIRDPNWHLADIAYLSQGDKIKIRYKITRDGVHLAQDIQVIKK